ncbi:hypothetical protein C8R44DRAFT_887703 [Mycena epipterygia]|nr:hypothetical protein C8R44DRAFT_887703 [Mycena epipterygia]
MSMPRNPARSAKISRPRPNPEDYQTSIRTELPRLLHIERAPHQLTVLDPSLTPNFTSSPSHLFWDAVSTTFRFAVVLHPVSGKATIPALLNLRLNPDYSALDPSSHTRRLKHNAGTRPYGGVAVDAFSEGSYFVLIFEPARPKPTSFTSLSPIELRSSSRSLSDRGTFSSSYRGS